MNNIKPIETVYKGYRFRSRLEARWAVFLDALGTDWEYEPEGFELPGGKRYLPDFRVKCYGYRVFEEDSPSDLYIEVKGEMTEEDLERIKEFSKEYPVLIVGNIPNSRRDLSFGLEYGPMGAFSFEFVDGDGYMAIPTSRKRGKFFLMGPDYYDEEGAKRFDFALKAARQARFEWGENGAPTRASGENGRRFYDWEEELACWREMRKKITELYEKETSHDKVGED
jgi:hypothetical protein